MPDQPDLKARRLGLATGYDSALMRQADRLAAALAEIARLHPRDECEA